MDHRTRLNNVIDAYFLIRELGKGSNSRHFLAVHQWRQTMHKIQVMHKWVLYREKRVRELFYEELLAMRSYRHPSIVPLDEILEDDRCVYVVTSHVNGPRIMDYILNSGKVQFGPNAEAVARRVFHQVVNIGTFLSRSNIPHFFKIENIIQAVANEKLILDSHRVSEDDSILRALPGASQRGVLHLSEKHYRSPELRGTESFTAAGISYACGIVLHILLTGKLPAMSSDFAQSSKQNPHRRTLILPQELSNGAKELILLLLRKKPELRLKLGDIPNHPWYCEGLLCMEQGSLLLDVTMSELSSCSREIYSKSLTKASWLGHNAEDGWPDISEITRPVEERPGAGDMLMKRNVKFEQPLPGVLKAKKILYSSWHDFDMRGPGVVSDAELMRTVIQDLDYAEQIRRFNSNVSQVSNRRRRFSLPKLGERKRRRQSETMSTRGRRSRWWTRFQFRSPIPFRQAETQ